MVSHPPPITITRSQQTQTPAPAQGLPPSAPSRTPMSQHRAQPSCLHPWLCTPDSAPLLWAAPLSSLKDAPPLLSWPCSGPLKSGVNFCPCYYPVPSRMVQRPYGGSLD